MSKVDTAKIISTHLIMILFPHQRVLNNFFQFMGDNSVTQMQNNYYGLIIMVSMLLSTTLGKILSSSAKEYHGITEFQTGLGGKGP